MEINNESNMNTKIVENHYHYHNYIYNIKEGKYPFLLQFKQLKCYYNQRKKFKNILSKGLNPQEIEKKELNHPVQNSFCLIDKIWLKKWKKHVGYKEIKNKIKKEKIERNLDKKDYQWISEIIDKNYKENYLNLLDNNTIYIDNEINPLADFKVVHHDSFNLFNINSETPEKNVNFRRYPISFYKDKYIIFLNNDTFFIAFKKINSIKFNEIIVDFIKIKEKIAKDNKDEYKIIKGSKKKIIDILFNKDTNEWLKEINFNYFEIEKEVELHNCLIKIYNKTLLLNNIIPNIIKKKSLLLNTNKVQNDSNKIEEFHPNFTKFYLREIKFIDNKDKIGSEIIFENFNEKDIKPLKINTQNNNGIKENNNLLCKIKFLFFMKES